MCQEPTELLWIDCLTELILIFQILIRYIDTKHQLADMLTKGNFTRDEWNNLLHLFNISHFSSLCCATNSILMKKRRVVSKSRPAAVNLSSLIATSSSTASSPIASKSPGILRATGKLESRMRRNSKSDAASSSQVRLQDASNRETDRNKRRIRGCGPFRI